MIFQTFNNDIDKSIAKIGIFNKSLWAIQQDFKHGNGLAFSIFGGQSVTAKDRQAILDFNTQLQNGVQPAKAWATTMSNCSIAAQTQTRQCLIAKGSLTELANSLETATISAKAASIAFKAFSIAGNIIAFTVIAKGIEAATTAINNWIHSAKIAQEKTEALSSSLTESQNKYAEDSKKIEELSSRYEILSEGVNHLGQNISLSSSQYNEYKSIIQQLSELMPNLTVRFNEQGEAIGFVGGKLKNVNKEYQEYQKNRAIEFLQEGDSDGNTYDDAINNLDENIFKERNFGYTNLEARNILQDVVDTYNNSFRGNEKASVLDSINEQLEDKDHTEIYGFQQLLGKNLFEIGELDEGDEFNQFIESLTQKIDTLKQKYEYAGTVIRDCMRQIAFSKENYWSDELGDEGRNKVSVILSGITTDFLKNNELTTKESQWAFVQKLIDSITENKDGISDALGNIFTLDIESMNVDDARTKIQEFCSIIANALNISLVDAQGLLGYKGFFQTADKYDRTVAYASGGYYKTAMGIKNSKGFNQKDVINAMEENSINTDEEIDRFKEILDTAKSLEDAIKKYIGDSNQASNNSIPNTFSEAWKFIGKSGNEQADKTALEAKEKLLELAEAGKLTAKEFSKLPLADYFKETGLSVDEVIEKINKMKSSADQLASMKTGISSITSILGEKKENLSSKKTKEIGIGADTLAGMPEDIKKHTKEYEHFVKVLGDGTSKMNDCKKAANRLATAYVASGNFLANLTDKNKDYYKSVLEEMGVENAAEIVSNSLTASKQAQELKTEALVAATKDIGKETSDATNEFLKQTKATRLAKIELADFIATEKIFGNSDLSTNSKVKELNKLAKSYFGVAEAIEMSNAISAMGYHSNFWNSREEYDAAVKEAEERIRKKWDKTVKAALGEVSNIKIDENAGGKKKDKDTGKEKDKSKSKQQFDWISRALDRLSSRLDLVKAKYDNLFTNPNIKDSDSLLEKRNKNLNDQYKLLQKIEKYQEKAQKKYQKKAKSIKLNDSLKKAVREGRIKGSQKELIAKYGEKKAEKIQQYQDWYEICHFA